MGSSETYATHVNSLTTSVSADREAPELIVTPTDVKVVRLDEPSAPPVSPRRVRRRILLSSLVGADVLATATSLWVASYIARHTVPDIASVLLGTIVMVASLVVFGLYRAYKRIAENVGGLRQVLPAAAAAALVLALVRPEWTESWFAMTFLGSAAAVTITRAIRLSLLRSYVERGALKQVAVIVGTDGGSIDIAHRLLEPGSGYHPVGYVDLTTSLISHDGLPVLGTLEEIADIIEHYSVETLFLTQPPAPQAALKIMQNARRAGVTVHVPAGLPIHPSRVQLQVDGDGTSLSLSPIYLDGGHAFLKRALDVAGSAIGLLLLAPLLAAIAAAIKLSSPGPVIFKQERITKDGRVFTMRKFRTMVRDGDRMLVERGIDPSTAFFKLDDDPRITRLGRWLRKLSLDELPQLYNVLLSDMSLVGPRPLPRDQVEAHPEMLEGRHEIRAGLTGWWQINGRSDIEPIEAVAMDLFYIENWSIGLDLRILLRTFGAVMARKGAV